MHVYISTDFEGVAGIVDWDQILQGRYDYEMGRRLLLGELNAAIEGALEAGATRTTTSRSTLRVWFVRPRSGPTHSTGAAEFLPTPPASTGRSASDATTPISR